MQPQILTKAGLHLSRCIQEFTSFPTSITDWPQEYEHSFRVRSSIVESVRSARGILLLGAGPSLSTITPSLLHDTSILKIGINWLNFHPSIPIDFIICSHTAPLQACRIYNPELLGIHFLYDKCPPVIVNTTTLRWFDPVICSNQDLTRIDQSLRTKILHNSLSATHSYDEICPQLPASRNILFIALSFILTLTRNPIYLAGFDPLVADYFFTAQSSIIHTILDCLLRSDRYINEWDGRHSRIVPKSPTRASLHSSTTIDVASQILSSSSYGQAKRHLKSEFYQNLVAYISFCAHRQQTILPACSSKTLSLLFNS